MWTYVAMRQQISAWELKGDHRKFILEMTSLSSFVLIYHSYSCSSFYTQKDKEKGMFKYLVFDIFNCTVGR